MDDIRHSQALITWHRDPSKFSRNEWIRDIVVDYEEIIGGGTQGGTWTVLVRITSQVEGTWDTYADVAFIVDEAPWHLWVPGYSFNLWAGKDVATVHIL